MQPAGLGPFCRSNLDKSADQPRGVFGRRAMRDDGLVDVDMRRRMRLAGASCAPCRRVIGQPDRCEPRWKRRRWPGPSMGSRPPCSWSMRRAASCMPTSAGSAMLEVAGDVLRMPTASWWPATTRRRTRRCADVTARRTETAMRLSADKVVSVEVDGAQRRPLPRPRAAAERRGARRCRHMRRVPRSRQLFVQTCRSSDRIVAVRFMLSPSTISSTPAELRVLDGD